MFFSVSVRHCKKYGSSGEKSQCPFSAVSVSWISLMDLTDLSAYGSFQPFAVVGITVLAYKADTDDGADKPQAG